MNSFLPPFPYFVILGLLLSINAVCFASPSLEDQGRPAAKPMADLNVGEPRTVRLVYFAPNDRPFRPDMELKMKRTIRQVQNFFAEQMQAHGYGNKTFRIETDADGEPIVHRLEGQYPDDHYPRDAHGTVFREIARVFNLFDNVYLAFMDVSQIPIPRGGRITKDGGQASSDPGFRWNIVAHELGHAFGLSHDYRDDSYIMLGIPANRLSACATEFLAVHPYFNPQVTTEKGLRPYTEFISPPEYPAGATSFSVQFRVLNRHGYGLHQIIVLTTTVVNPLARRGAQEVKACRGLEGKHEAVVELEFEDHSADYFYTHVFRPIHVQAIDTDGNVGYATFNLVEVPQNRIAKLEGHESGVRSVSFSPGGTTLASGSLDGTVKLWDVEMGTDITTFSGGHPVAFSPDGTILASGSSGSGLALWDVATRETIATLGGHGGEVTSVSFSMDGGTLAMGSGDGTVRLLDVATRETIATLEGHGGEVTSVSFSMDGGTLAMGSGDGTVKLWDVATRETIATLEEQEEEITSVSFSMDGGTLAMGSGDGTVKLWDVATRETIATLEGHGGEVTSVSFSSDGKVLASGSEDRTVILWDILTKEIFVRFGHTAAVSSVAFSGNDTTLASGSSDGIVRLWNVSEWTGPRPLLLVKISGDNQQGTPGGELENPFVVEVRDQNDNPLRGAEVAFRISSGDGFLGGRFTVEKATTDAEGRVESILTLGPNSGVNTVEVSVAGPDPLVFNSVGVGTPSVSVPEGNYPAWHLPEAAIIRLGKGRIGATDRSVEFSPDGQILAVASNIGVWLYDAATLDELSLLPIGLANSVSFSPDGTTLALGSGRGADGGLTLWDLATGTRTTTLGGRFWVKYVSFSPDGKILASGTSGPKTELWDAGTGTHIATLRGHTSPGSSVSFSPDGTILATGEEDGTVRLWDLATHANTATLEGHRRLVESVSFSPDGTTLASASYDGTVRLWDVATSTHSGTLRGGETNMFCVTFSPDGATLATGASNGTVKLWELATGENIATFPPHAGFVRSVVFSPDGTTLASASEDGAVNLWHLATESAASISGHTSVRSEMAFSPDGSTLASSSISWGGLVHLWDVATGRNIATLSGHDWRLSSVSFSPDGTTLATGAADRTLRLWDLATRSTIAILEHSHWVNALSFSPDGTILASGDGDGNINFWNTKTKEKISSLSNSRLRNRIRELSFSPDGKTVASGSDVGDVRVWDVETGNSTAILEGHRDEIVSLSFTPDGATLITASREGIINETLSNEYWIKLWDLATGTEVNTLKGNYVDVIAVSPDGTMFATGSQDNKVRLGDVATGATIATLEGHAHGVNGVLFSPDGTVLASGSLDGTILLWDVQHSMPHPQTLAMVSGDDQEGLLNSQLENSFVVEVRDQNGKAFEGAQVMFTITAGDGTLSTEAATTDSSGRASTILTLGRKPGVNIVEVTAQRVEPVSFTAVGVAVPMTLSIVSGGDQKGPVGTPLENALVVSVLDQNGEPFAGAVVTFAITSGDGTLSAEAAITDSSGRASSTLTLGRGSGTNTVVVTVVGLDPVTFSALAEASPDFDGDGVTNFAGFFLFADAFGTTDARFDLDGSGVVDFGDFFIFADAFGQPARAKLLALAAKLIGLPEGPQLRQNVPNPFNSQTEISYFLLAPGPARLEVYALTGQRVAVLHQGAQPAGLHRLHWNGRDDDGRTLASGIYLYRLVTSEGTLSRKLVLLR